MGDVSDWRSSSARQRIVQNFEAALRKGTVNNHIDTNQLMEYETKIFQHATGHDDYKSKLGKLFQHLTRIPVKKQGTHGNHSQAPRQQQLHTMYHPTPPQQPSNMATMTGQNHGGHMHQMAGHPIMLNSSQQQMMPGQQHMNQQMGQQQSIGQQPMGQQQPIGQQPMGQQQPIGQQPMGQQPMMPTMPSTTYSNEPVYGQPSIPSQPQIPAQANVMSRPLYSPGQGLPMPSPTPSIVRVPQPSPSMSVNTPAPNIAMTPGEPQAPSPASLAPPSGSTPTVTDEEQMYMDKVRELSTYVEPLKKMLAKMSKEGKTNQADYQKLLVLLNLLQPNNNNKTTTYSVLCKCEDVLKKLKLPPPFKPTSEVIPEQSSHWCQPLLTSVAENIMNSSLCKHALRQTFGPAMHMLYGSNIGASVEQRTQAKKRKVTSESTALSARKSAKVVPHLIQGELARLDKRFKVTRDRNYQDEDEYNDGMGLRLQCALVDVNLPSVPAIKFTLPDDYPDSPPLVDTSLELYDSSDFFKQIKTKFVSSLKRLQNKYSMTSLLETWLASVKQICINVKEEKATPNQPILAT